MKTVVFYIADQKWYADEAVISAKSLQTNMPFIDTLFFTPNEKLLNIDGFTHVYPLSPRKYEYFYLDHTVWFVDAFNKIYSLGDYDTAIFMDCDTYVCAPFHGVFDILDNGFDFLGVHAPGRQTTQSALELTTAFPEINLGFNPFHVNTKMMVLFDRCKSNYINRVDVYRNNDQGALRDTLWEFGQSYKFNLYVLPPEYNLRFNFACFASGEVKILHGHSRNIEKVAERVNATTEMRSWKSGELSDS